MDTERRRELLEWVADRLMRMDYADRMRRLARGECEPDEALEGHCDAFPALTNDQLLESICADLDASKAIRDYADKHGAQWSQKTRDRWIADADRMESDARKQLGLDQAPEQTPHPTC